ncbi:hypothetical protein WJX73_001546 [Symbiochloris irregularis]|uniref:Uncharacterized protein n=1 Tax=Symbiochloris irregularis TaxID=706552 RepID=A0AAW1PN24_9CHLO
MPSEPATKVKKPATKTVRRAEASLAQVAQLEEQLRSEHKAQQLYLQRLALKNGTTYEYESTSAKTAGARKPVRDSKQEEQEKPELLLSLQKTAQGHDQTSRDASRLLAMSINPGYVLREEKKMDSTTRSSYEPDQEELDYMKRLGMMDSEHHRKRNDLSEHVEAMARSGLNKVRTPKEAAPENSTKPK